MWAMIVVIINPDFDLISHLVNILEQLSVKYSFSECAVKSFDKSVLHGLSRLNILDGDLVRLTPIRKSGSSKLRSIIYSDLFGLALFMNCLA